MADFEQHLPRRVQPLRDTQGHFIAAGPVDHEIDGNRFAAERTWLLDAEGCLVLLEREAGEWVQIGLEGYR